MTIAQTHPRAHTLPQLRGGTYLTDGGIETSLIHHQGADLPLFAAFVLLETEEGRRMLEAYYRPYLAIAAAAGTGFILESPTWRASPDWMGALGYTDTDVARINRLAIALMERLRGAHDGAGEVVISGCIGPRADGYAPGTLMTPSTARAYHAAQIAAFAESGADLVTAITMTHAGEAAGIARAAAECAMPVVISFTVEVDGRLPSGQPLGEAILAVDAATGAAPAYYMVNCAHPDHFADVLAVPGKWRERIRGVRANASRRSHAELDGSDTLDDGDPAGLASDYARLREILPWLSVFGGCCGTDHRHVGEIALRVVP